MEEKNHYIINPDTVLIKSEFDSLGNHCSRVIQGRESFLVKEKPADILNNSMLYYGSNLPGGIQSTKSKLGNISMCPVVVCSQLNIYWFPLYSPKSEKCIWLAFTHVGRPEKLSPLKTRVNLRFGHSFELNMKISRFKAKHNQAAELRYITEERNQKGLVYYYDPRTGLQLVSEKNPYYSGSDKD
ncbi:competence protein ComK [Peribacillus kribbensis]|uniref:competence protein ComK n=1 Tax=Peribacillus kribbensis TaxID=356658 RepID=UPI00040F54B8|nr:competence protein ComK [Peribacillus kribbensis]